MKKKILLFTIMPLAFIACSRILAMDAMAHAILGEIKMHKEAATQRNLMPTLTENNQHVHPRHAEVPKTHATSNNTHQEDWNRIDEYGTNLNTDLLFNNEQ